jgi:RNA polymerase sigma-70 factor (ECF subfamily)
MPAFQTTRWSLVLAARDHTPDAQAALDALCRVYRPAVLTCVLSRCRNRAQAEDLTQDFFARFLEYRYQDIADPARGRFRTFLGAALNNYLGTHAERQRALKRGGGLATEVLDEEHAGADERESPEHAFDLAWALTVLDHALEALRAEAAGNGKAALFERLREFLTDAPDADDYAQAAADLGLRQNTVAVSVHRLRERLRDVVRKQLADTVVDPADVDDELRSLRAVLGGIDRAGGRRNRRTQVR